MKKVEAARNDLASENNSNQAYYEHILSVFVLDILSRKASQHRASLFLCSVVVHQQDRKTNYLALKFTSQKSRALFFMKLAD